MACNPSGHYVQWPSGLFAIAGVVIGTVLTYFLTNRSQRHQWSAENRKTEFRELLTAINEGYTSMLALSASEPSVYEPAWKAWKERLLLAETNGARAIADRLFIADDVRQ